MLTQTTVFARKSFKIEYTREGIEEWDTLLKIRYGRKPQHEHIVEAFGAYAHGPSSMVQRLFITFPWAESTLAKYLSGTSGLTITSQVLWGQMEGVAHGLAALHHDVENPHIHDQQQDRSAMVRFFHLDFKPANILIFRKDATSALVFKIADFGLARVRKATQYDGSSSANCIPYRINDYAPPDGSPLDSAEEESASDKLAGYDLWCLGAIFSEVAAFDSLGKDGLKSYREDREKEYKESSEHRNVAGPYFFDSKKNLMKSVRAQHVKIQKELKNSKELVHGDMQAISNGELEWKQAFYVP
jgi:serine/threonine protein kinase